MSYLLNCFNSYKAEYSAVYRAHRLYTKIRHFGLLENFFPVGAKSGGVFHRRQEYRLIDIK